MDNERKKIEVKPEDVELIRRAEKIEREANERAKAEEAEASQRSGKDIHAAMEFFDTKEDMRILRWRDELAHEYQVEYELPVAPILIPPPQPPMPTVEAFGGSLGPPSKSGVPMFQRGQFPPRNGPFHPYDRQRDGPPIPEQLKDRFLQMVPTFRRGERLYFWEGSHYRYFSDSEAKARIKSVLRSEIYIPNPTALLNSVLGLLKAEENIIGLPDSYPYLMAVQNGEVDLNTMTLNPAIPDHFLTHYLDVWWDGPQPCPVFSAFLDRTTGGDPELRQRLLESVGYLLVSDYRPKRFVVFQGTGDCGKSVLGNLIASFFAHGDTAALADFQFGERFSISFIANCRLCLSMDLGGGTIDAKAVSMLKQITGGDLVSVEAKGKDAYSDHIRCKVLFGTNYPIQLKSRDHAFARRLLLVPFLYPVPPEQQDRDLLTKLMAERSGILYMALTAYRDVVTRGFRFTGEERFGFTAQQIIVEEQGPDSMALFCNSCCVLEQESFTPTKTLHETFKSFCAANMLPAINDRAAFSHALNTYFCGQIRSDKRRVDGVPTNGYWGIRLREAGDTNV